MIAYLFPVGIVVFVVFGILRACCGGPAKPREPVTDWDPRVVSFLAARDVTPHWAPVSAVTPAGLVVRRGRCCRSGHQSPMQAADCARRVAASYAATGRP